MKYHDFNLENVNELKQHQGQLILLFDGLQGYLVFGVEQQNFKRDLFKKKKNLSSDEHD